MRGALTLVALAPVAVAAVGFLPDSGAPAARAAFVESSSLMGVRNAPSKALTGRVWVLAALLGRQPVRGSEITSAFTTAGKVSGSAGCNHYSGTYTSSGSTIRISAPLASTRKVCTHEVDVQEKSFLKTLASARRFSVNGVKLTLKTAAGKAILTYKAQSQQLAGTSWTVLAFNNGKQAVVSVLGGTMLTAEFEKGGTLTGSAGCNDYNAPYQATAPKISIGAVASTRKHCADPEGVMDQESQYLAALQSAATYRVEGTRLEIRTAAGSLAAELQRR
jgi:heat shock protein HslJ